MGELEHKYEVDIKEREGRQKLPDDVKAELKASGIMDEDVASKFQFVADAIEEVCSELLEE